MTPLFCPKPQTWHRVHQELDRARKTTDGSIPPPPVPLILNGWVFSSARDKHDRWAATVAWAEAAGLTNIVRSIPTTEFEHWDHDVPGWSPEQES